MTAYDGSGVVPPYSRDALRRHQVQGAMRAADMNPGATELRHLTRALRAVQTLHSAAPVGPDDESSICRECHDPAPCDTWLAAGGAR